MAVKISKATEAKLLEKHGVTREEVEQCFQNICGQLLLDTREDHQSDPPTLWFIAPTNANRLLKVCFIPRGGDQHVRTCYPPNAVEMQIYRAHGKPRDF